MPETACSSASGHVLDRSSAELAHLPIMLVEGLLTSEGGFSAVAALLLPHARGRVAAPWIRVRRTVAVPERGVALELLLSDLLLLRGGLVLLQFRSLSLLLCR